MTGFQAVLRLPRQLFWGTLLLLCVPLAAQLSKPASQKTPIDAKCSFLRSEAKRIADLATEATEQSPLANVKTAEDLQAINSTIPDWANYFADQQVLIARRTLLGQKIASCLKGVKLSDTSRLNGIEAARTAQIRRAGDAWELLSKDQGKDVADGILAKINAVYEAETKSFYNPAIAKLDDPDVGKDYSDLPDLLRSSNLDQGTKDFYIANVSHLRYEEAGKLTNTLTGQDKQQGLNYAYILRNALATRLTSAARQESTLQSEQRAERNSRLMSQFSTYAIFALIVLVVAASIWILTDRTRAKFRAFRLGLKRSPFWFGNAEWVFWEPGETVVLLRHKKLVPMTDRDGGYVTISPWKGEEFKGRISYKTQCSTWKSDPIITSDGLAVNLNVGIWWRIVDAGLYVSRIASDYHEGDHHKDENLGEAAEFWIKKLAAGTLREEINQLPAEKLISPYVQQYLQVTSEDGLASQAKRVPDFKDQLGNSKVALDAKTQKYGIEIESLEVQELILPPVYQEKLEAVRVAFLEPTQAKALSDAQVIALSGLASVIGPEKVGLIEVLKHVDLSKIGMNPFTGTIPILQPVVNTLQQQTEKALPSPQLPGGSGQ